MQSAGQSCSALLDQTETTVEPDDDVETGGSETDPLIDHRPQQSVPASEMRAVSFVGALLIPVSHVHYISSTSPVYR